MPKLRLAAVQKALALFSRDDGGELFLGGNFGALKVSLAVNARNTNPHHRAAAVSLRAASHDLWNIAAIVERLEWMRQLAIEQDSFEAWSRCAQLDVAHVIYEFRSIFDLVAGAVGSLSLRPGTMPDSFEKLIKNRDKYRKNLGSMYAPLNRDFAWFYDLRVLRTAIIHRGSEPLVFCGPEDGLLFQIHGKNHENLISIPGCMFNPNVVRFEPYVGYYFAELLVFLEDLAGAAMSEIDFPIPMTGVKNSCGGYRHLVCWMEGLAERLSAAET